MSYYGADYAAAGALGYIAGNVPGAVGALNAYGAYKKLTQNKTKMPKTKEAGVITYLKKRKRRNSLSTLGGTPKKRRGSTASSMSQSSVNKKTRSKLYNSINQDATVVIHKKVKDTLKNKRTFKKKVSKKFRSAVKQVLTESKVRGYYRMYFTGGSHSMWNGDYSWPVKAGDLDQWVFSLPLNYASTVATAIRNGDAIGRLMLLHAVSRCFNGKNPSLNVPIQYQDTDNITDPPAYGTGNDSPSGLKIDVLESKCFIEMKNNSNQVYNIEMYVCKPKMKRRANFTYPNKFACLAVADWNDEILMLKNARVETEGQPSNTPARYGQLVSPDILASSLGLSPEGFPTWKSLWAYEKYVIRLEPGKIHKHVVVGDSCTVDFSKDYKDSAFQFLTPFERQVFYIAKPDLSYGFLDNPISYPSVGRNAVDDAGGDIGRKPLCFEVQQVYKFAMPEPVGFRQDLTVNAVFDKTLNNRNYRFAIDYNQFTTDDIEVTQQADDNVPSNNMTG